MNYYRDSPESLSSGSVRSFCELADMSAEALKIVARRIYPPDIEKVIKAWDESIPPVDGEDHKWPRFLSPLNETAIINSSVDPFSLMLLTKRTVERSSEIALAFRTYPAVAWGIIFAYLHRSIILDGYALDDGERLPQQLLNDAPLIIVDLFEGLTRAICERQDVADRPLNAYVFNAWNLMAIQEQFERRFHRQVSYVRRHASEAYRLSANPENSCHAVEIVADIIVSLRQHLDSYESAFKCE